MSKFIKKSIAILIAASMMLMCSCGTDKDTADSSSTASKASSKAPQAEQKYERVVVKHDSAPVMRFMLISDVHNANDVFASAIEATDRYAKTQEYKGFDAVVAVGDLSNSGTEDELKAFKAAFDKAKAATGQDISLITCMGNHDFGNKSHSDDENKQYVARFEQIMGQKATGTFDVKGYEFIAVSPKNHAGDYNEAATWLINELNSADKEKPLFILQHYQPMGTVVQCGAYSGTSAVKEAISTHSNVIDFCGHSHAPITNLRSLYQGASGYTVYNTGSFSNSSAFDDETQGSGYYTSKQFSIYEVYADNVVDVKLYDLETDALLGVTYQIGGKVDNRTDFLQKASAAPEFASDAKVTVDAVGPTAIQVSFPQATDDDGVEKYRVDVLSSDNKAVSSVLTTSYYFRTDKPATLSQTAGGLKENTEYTATVTAIDFYGNESKPLSTEKFKTGSYPAGLKAVVEGKLTKSSASLWNVSDTYLDDQYGFSIPSMSAPVIMSLKQTCDLSNKWMISADYFRATYNLTDNAQSFSAMQVGDLTAVIQRTPTCDKLYLCCGYNSSMGTPLTDKCIVAQCELSSCLGATTNLAMTYENGQVKVYRDGYTAISVTADQIKAKVNTALSFSSAQVNLILADRYVVDKHGARFDNIVLKK